MLGTLQRRFAATVAVHPDRVALVAGEQTLTWGALAEEADRAARVLADEAAVGPGDVVGLLLTNRLELVTAFLACQRLGAVTSCLNFRVAPAAVAAAAAHERQVALVHDAQFDAAARAVSEAAAGCRLLTAEALAERAAAAPDRTPPPGAEAAADRACNVIHTSGTTGMPKGAALTHETQLLSGLQYCLEMGLDRGRVGMSLAPIVIGAATNFFVAFLLVAGARQVLMADYEAVGALRAVERDRVTDLFAVPTQIYQMADAARERDDLDLGSLRLIRTGGSAMPAELVQRAREALGCEILNTYGTTESCTAITTIHTGHDPAEKWGSIGRPTYFQEVRVIAADDPAAGSEDVVEPPGRGQLLNRGPQAAESEFMAPDRPLCDADGWQHTRDVVEIDADGYLFPVDRLDNVIVSGGENIYPQEVELALATHPGVADVAVLGAPDPEWGERVAALVVARDPELDAEALEQFWLANPEWARHKRPRLVALVDELPRNILGKLDRHALPALLSSATDPSDTGPGEG
jgi:long-chain acyl-CoA synthetase